jgi:hypothetical protein
VTASCFLERIVLTSQISCRDLIKILRKAVRVLFRMERGIFL